MVSVGLKIAVVMGQNGTSAAILDADAFVRVYRQAGARWEPACDFPLELHPERGMDAVRAGLHGVIDALTGVRAVVLRQISGIHFAFFCAAGLYVYELKGKPEQFLDFAALRVQAGQRVLREPRRPMRVPGAPWPRQFGPEGCYFLDIIKMQMESPHLTTKDVLLPFLENVAFTELELICSRLPLWLERQHEALRVAYREDWLGPELLKLTLRPAG